MVTKTGKTGKTKLRLSSLNLKTFFLSPSSASTNEQTYELIALRIMNSCSSKYVGNLINQELVTREDKRGNGRKEDRKEGREEGRKAGRKNGRKEERKDGRTEGKQEERTEGRTGGRTEGRKTEGCKEGRKKGRKD